MLKAALHVHSTYSDGEFTLADLKRIYVQAGCSVVGITDHDDHFDAPKLADYIAECESLSDGQFTFLCGLEFRCEKEMHILGYGCTTLADTQDPQEIIRHIELHRGLAVIAHPKDSMFPWIETFATLPQGIETWNSKYDGRYAPRPGTFDLLKRLQSRRPAMRAFYGQDLHWKKQFRGLFTELHCENVNRTQILAALENGRFAGVKAALRLPSTGDISLELHASFAAKHAQSDRMRRFVKAGKKTIDKLGIRPPAALKSHLRKIF
ncbi:MAG TPA: PHP domain-containing protein [Candidatus Solibacter sp.]|nr:PHP domain-containing protein [Candidatus Solibacter sp.]